ncbi:MAG: hypothetical protein IPP25_11445 [Saprospiraceae bacterium]|nr:hypothetical protein [Candidatus Opimibacter skivensis]
MKTLLFFPYHIINQPPLPINSTARHNLIGILHVFYWLQCIPLTTSKYSGSKILLCASDPRRYPEHTLLMSLFQTKFFTWDVSMFEDHPGFISSSGLSLTLRELIAIVHSPSLT